MIRHRTSGVEEGRGTLAPSVCSSKCAPSQRPAGVPSLCVAPTARASPTKSSEGTPDVAQLWLEETDKAVGTWQWSHRSPEIYGRVRLGSAGQTGAGLPQKSHETGPPQEERCHTCIGEQS